MLGLWAELTDLLLPAGCAGCGVVRVPLRYGVCIRCARALEALSPHPVRPTPAPAGLPPCVALGTYRGALREALLAYKERGRHGLARPLGRLLAEVVVAALTETAAPGVVATARVPPGAARRPVLLVPVPATARAARARHGDHLRRLARYAAGGLRRAGWSVAVSQPLYALPRADSTTLDSTGRATAALAALRRAAERGAVVVLDDIVTTGATLAAVTGLLTGAGVRVHAAAVLAATARRQIR